MLSFVNEKCHYQSLQVGLHQVGFPAFPTGLYCHSHLDHEQNLGALYESLPELGFH